MSSRDRSILAVLVLVIVAVGGYFLIDSPPHSKASKLQSEISSAQATLGQAREQVQQGLTAETEYNSYAKQLTALTAAVPADAQIPTLINELQSAATRTHTGFEEVAVAGGSSASSTPTTATATPATTGAAAFPSQSFSLQFNGTYFSVADLLGTLTSYVQSDNKKFSATGRLLTISSVAFASGSGGFPNVTASVTTTDYDIPSSLGSSTATSSPAS